MVSGYRPIVLYTVTIAILSLFGFSDFAIDLVGEKTCFTTCSVQVLCLGPRDVMLTFELVLERVKMSTRKEIADRPAVIVVVIEIAVELNITFATI